MSTEKFDILFSGQIMEGQDEAEVRTKVGHIFKANEKQLERLFSGQAVKIKSGVDLDSAVKYRVAFRNAGALIDIKPATAASPETTAQPQAAASQPSEAAAQSQDAASQPSAAPQPAAKDEIELLPPKTGSLIDCASAVTPAAIPNIDGLDFDSTDAPLDKTEPPPPADIDTQNLTLNPADSETMLDETAPPPPADIDTNDLDLNPANTGSLEDCQQVVEPAEIPDISALEMVEPKAQSSQ
ncbi:hypothetical protein ACFL3U_00045 [Pseudomonadota bacterium]